MWRREAGRKSKNGSGPAPPVKVRLLVKARKMVHASLGDLFMTLSVTATIEGVKLTLADVLFFMQGRRRRAGGRGGDCYAVSTLSGSSGDALPATFQPL